MKYITLVLCLIGLNAFAQSSSQNEVLKLSADIFKYEVENKIDSVANILHQDFLLVNSDGAVGEKEAYIKRLSGNDFKHNSIEILENKAVVSGNTATVIGSGKFNITANGNQRVLKLSYIEVFTRKSEKEPWKMLALKANAIN